MIARPSIVCIAVALAACAPAAQDEPAMDAAPQIDLDAERAALMAADRMWFEAYSTSDSPAAAFVDMMVDGAFLLPPGAPLAEGKDAIRAVIAALEATPGFSVEWGPTLADVGSGGDLGYTLGTYEMHMEADGEPVVIAGKYITVWKKQADGSWKVAVDTFNDDGPPAPAG